MGFRAVIVQFRDPDEGGINGCFWATMTIASSKVILIGSICAIRRKKQGCEPRPPSKKPLGEEWMPPEAHGYKRNSSRRRSATNCVEFRRIVARLAASRRNLLAEP